MVTKKLLSTILAVSISVFYAAENVSAVECTSGEYVISAYYSPVPGQSRYATGTYEADIRLNGGGVTTASGVKVADAPGPFVAGPPCFAFGTVLEIEGLGRHLVLDRGGAIKGNRLDIWMGYGDVGLVNALTWGKRAVYVSIVSGNDLGTFSFDLGKQSLKSYQETKSNDPFEFLRSLAFGDSGEDVARLQQILKDVGYFKGVVNGTYDELTKQAVADFHTASGAIKSTDIERTGRFGGDSVVKLKEFVGVTREKYFDSPIRNLGRGSSGPEVTKLQQFLISIGLLKSVTGVYDSATVEAVIAFQIAEKIINSPNDEGAGYFGPSTQIAYDRLVNKSEFFEDTVNTGDDIVYLESVELINDSLSLGSEGEEVVRLQRLLSDIGLFRLEPTGYFGPVTAHAVYVFQRRIGIVSSASDPSAGFVGPATRNSLNSLLNDRANFIARLTKAANVQLTSEIDFKFSRELDLGDTGEDVKFLQEFLRNLGYFNGTILTDFFGPVTKSSLIRFKEDNGLSTNENSSVLDSNTIDLINSLI